MILEKLDDMTDARIAQRAAKWQADEVYDREWATSLVRQALDRLAQECALAGKRELFDYVVPYLAAPQESANPIRRDGAALTSSCRYFALRASPIAQALSGNSA
jgi:hypothetical protein